jgi:hypothetical protein
VDALRLARDALRAAAAGVNPDTAYVLRVIDEALDGFTHAVYAARVRGAELDLSAYEDGSVT